MKGFLWMTHIFSFSCILFQPGETLPSHWLDWCCCINSRQSLSSPYFTSLFVFFLQTFRIKFKMTFLFYNCIPVVSTVPQQHLTPPNITRTPAFLCKTRLELRAGASQSCTSIYLDTNMPQYLHTKRWETIGLVLSFSPLYPPPVPLQPPSSLGSSSSSWQRDDSRYSSLIPPHPCNSPPSPLCAAQSLLYTNHISSTDPWGCGAH